MSDFKKSLRHSFLQAVLVVLLSALGTWLISSTIWSVKSNLIHAVLELSCIFIAISIFVLIWLLYERYNDSKYHFIGFGFFIVILFLVLHLLEFNRFGLGEDDISYLFAITSRIIEAILLFIISRQAFKIKINRYLGLILSLIFTAAVYAVLLKLNLIIELYSMEGFTWLSHMLNWTIIAMISVSFFFNAQRFQSKDIISFRYIGLAMLLAIFTNISFELQGSPASYYHILGHILRLSFYCCLFKGIFINTVIYPYEMLEHSNAAINEILDEMPIAITTYDKDLTLSFLNKKAENLIGYKREELKGLTAEQISYKFYDMKNYLETFQRSRDNHCRQIRELKNALEEKVKIISDTYKLGNGSYLCLFEEAKNVQALENLQLQTQTILDALSNSVLITDMNNKIIMCNQAFAEVIEMDVPELVGMDLNRLNDVIDFSHKGLRERIFKGEEGNGVHEVSFTTTSGKVKTLLKQYALIPNVDGEVIGTISVATDITAFKKQQKTQLQEEKMALLGQMAAGVVHEIKNPLTAILGFGQLINKKTEDKNIKEYAHIIIDEVQSLNKVVSDFLTFAKPRTPICNQVSLNHIVESMKFIIESHGAMKGITVKFSNSVSEALVSVDENQIKQVILNIVHNAVDATEGQEKPVISIRTGCNKAAGEAYIAIYNNGKPMSEEEKLMAGTPFFTTKDYGTGLGLGICYQIVNENRGRMEFESQPGFGTTFVLTFPLHSLDDTRVS